MLLFGQDGSSLSFPTQASSFAGEVDFMYHAIFWISAFFFVLINGLMVYFIYKYRKRPGHDRPIPSPSHSTKLEVAWTVLPCFLLIWMFARGAYGYLEMRNPPDNCKEIWVTASQWQWAFHYPEEGPSADLHLTVNQPVKLRMASTDVLHSFFIPEFRQKMDIIPGRYVWVWFQPTRPSPPEGFHLRCTEYCGDGHSAPKMSQKKVHVHDMSWDMMLEKFVKWEDAKNEAWKNGERRYQMLCSGCHSIDGVKKIGPSFLGAYGTTVKFTNGTEQVVDDDYLKQSMLEPNALVRSGYESPNGESQMPARFLGKKLSEDEVMYLIAYIKKLNASAATDGAAETNE